MLYVICYMLHDIILLDNGKKGKICDILAKNPSASLKVNLK